MFGSMTYEMLQVITVCSVVTAASSALTAVFAIVAANRLVYPPPVRLQGPADVPPIVPHRVRTSR